MASVAVFRVRPLGPITLKPPMPFTAGVHGPAAVGVSLSYPMPSTLAGLLASIAYTEGCSDNAALDPRQPFRDQEACLTGMLGEGFRLYTGFLEAPTGIHVYVNTGEMPRLQDALQEERCGERPVVRAVRERRIGVALDPSSKSVREGLLYSLESILYRPEASILVLAHAPSNPRVDTITKLGAKTGLARIAAPHSPPPPLDNAQPAKLEPGMYDALLASPALLPRNKNPLGGDGKPILLSNRETRRAIAENLLQAAGIHGHGEAKTIPKGEHSLEVTMPGWSTRPSKPRPPMLLVPPGTRLTLTIHSPHDAIAIGEELYITGLGCCSRLGWGTAILRKK